MVVLLLCILRSARDSFLLENFTTFWWLSANIFKVREKAALCFVPVEILHSVQ